jgi:hypothetical protein
MAFLHDRKTSSFCGKETGLHANQENGVDFAIAKDHEDQVETHHEVVKQKMVVMLNQFLKSLAVIKI